MAYQDDDTAFITDVIHRIQIYVLPRRIRMREFFIKFDPLNSGRCTRVQFGRGLDTAGFKQITDVETERLADHFTETGPRVQKPQVVNYKKFCEAVEKIFNDGDVSFKSAGLSKSDGFNQSFMDDAMFKASATSFMPNDLEDMEKMDHIMHRMATLCKTKGFVFKALYHDFERSMNPSPSNINPRRGGKCTANQFRRLFPFKKEMSPDDIEYIIQRYSTPAGDVHFYAIHNDISEVLSPEPPPFPQSPLYLKPDGTTWDHMTLNPVKKIQSKVVERRIRLSEFFSDFDPLRKGFCTAGQLKAVITITNLEKEIDRNDFAHLVEAYTREDGMFCHALFVRDVDAAFSVPGLEKEPLATTPLPDASTTAPGRRNRMNISSSTRAKINALEDKIRSRVVKRRVLMKPMFEDMDKARKGLVSRNQFLRVMGSLLNFDITTEEVSLLAMHYCDRGNHNDFNYREFLKACDPPDSQQEIAMSQLSSPYQDQAPSKYFDGPRVRPLDRSMSAGMLIS
jgi:Ca2+-binding EF-hand superfamily protein